MVMNEQIKKILVKLPDFGVMKSKQKLEKCDMNKCTVANYP